ncbi:MAG: hypothetical protein V4543_08855 [Bacteroidota bacterium]
MEPLISIEGYKLRQDPKRAKRLFENFYKDLGYIVITDNQAENNSDESVETGEKLKISLYPFGPPPVK